MQIHHVLIGESQNQAAQSETYAQEQSKLHLVQSGVLCGV